ncbi:MAG: Rrf2 family transcriptional regulator [Eggerthellaceae bacterium]|jgi:DNA-binding IscR family transcriptional regulator
MRISTKFTTAVHILVASVYFGPTTKVTSSFLADSIGSNPVMIRNIMTQLQQAGIIEVKRGSGGIEITRPLSEITFLDIYRAVETNADDPLFHFHENPNPDCPVGRNIHGALDAQLDAIQQNLEDDLASRNVASVYESVLQAAERQAEE